ncbi:MAG TPA: LPXTG cell wall anchor domain-containing protein, partial [Acidimicrobiales bacterium]|nr:LPXTG cell wall anchor domain-containing protein [Acidimicrobiales bacterium]
MRRGTIRSAVVAVATVLVVLLALSAMGIAVAAGPIIDRAGQALRTDAVYVDPDAQRTVSAEDAERIRDEVRAGSHPVYVAVLPGAVLQEAGGDPNDVVTALRRATGLRGTYAVLAGNAFRAASDVLPRGQAGDLATEVLRQHRDDGAGTVLREFVSSVQRLETSALDRPGADGQAGDAPAEDGGGDGGSSVLPLLLVGGAAVGGGALLWRRRRKEQERRERLEGLRRDLRLDLQLLADDVVALEPQVAMHPDAREDYDAGATRYRWAQAAVDAIDDPDDVPRIRRALTEGQYAFARARARIDGREPPPPPPELRVQGPRGEPAVEVDEDGRPAYMGYGGGWYGGGFFGGSDLFTGLLLGSMLGGGWGWGGGGGYGYERGYEEGRGDAAQDDGGDSGEGDFG